MASRLHISRVFSLWRTGTPSAMMAVQMTRFIVQYLRTLSEFVVIVEAALVKKN